MGKKKPELSKIEKKYNKKDVFALKDVFDDADADGSGEIDANELRKALNKSNLGDAADDFFKAIDTDGSKKIGFDEYLKVSGVVRWWSSTGEVGMTPMHSKSTNTADIFSIFNSIL
jgi:Ca2+-binding EF-hand superfamily protein